MSFRDTAIPGTPRLADLQAALARFCRAHPDDTAGADEIRRELRTARAAEYISKIVDSAPPLTAEQRDRLAALLRSPGGAE